MILSQKFPSSKMGSNYFVGYEKDVKVTPMYVFLLKLSGCVKNVNDAKNICFYLSDPKFNDKYLQANIKSYNKKITTTFQGRVPNAGRKCICLSSIIIDSFVKSSKNCYPLKSK